MNIMTTLGSHIPSYNSKVKFQYQTMRLFDLFGLEGVKFCSMAKSECSIQPQIVIAATPVDAQMTGDDEAVMFHL